MAAPMCSCFRMLFGRTLKLTSHSAPVRFYVKRNILWLHERGMLQDIFPASCPKLPDILTSAPQSMYAGFDPTADSLHIGNLLVIMTLLHSQRAGHNAIALIGGATAQIGDPSGRTSERKPLAADVLMKNAHSIESSLRRIFANHELIFWDHRNKTEPLPPVKILNNLDWYSNTNIIEFLATIGRSFRLGTMMSRQSVQTRLNSSEGMNFTEFTYQIFQAYDWLYLYDKYRCIIQLGGSDQMGNIHSGRDLIARLRDAEVYGITVPLVTAETGDKYGKSAGNAVWLNPDKTSSFDLYQFYIRLPDSEVEKFLRLFTFFSLAEIKHIMEKHWKNPEARSAQKKLAEVITLLIHGEEGLQSAKRVTEALYAKSPESLVSLGEEELLLVAGQAPCVELLLQPGTTVLELAMQARCFQTEEDAKRIISAGGLYINHRRVSSPSYVLILGEHILPNNISLIRVGKKNYYIVKWLM